MRNIIVFAALVAAVFGSQAAPSTKKVFCYYDSRSYVRESQARMLPSDLDPALPFCTHLLYGYAGISPDTYKMMSLNENLDIGSTHMNYKTITGLKAKYPQLKVLLSVGGDADLEDTIKYNQLLESPQARTAFINSGVLMTEQYGFDGIDLAWQFPRTKPKKVRSAWGSFWHGVKKTFRTTPVDDKETEHREGFTALVREMKAALSLKPNRHLTVTVLPNVNSTIYFDVKTIINFVDYVNIDAYDFFTPERNPQEGDFSAPIYALQNRDPLHNIDSVVSIWLHAGAPSQKLILGISAAARTWKLDGDSEKTGVPPIHTDGAGEAGPYTKMDGILSYPEVCKKLTANQAAGIRSHLRKVPDPSKRFGTYAFHLPDDTENGIWVSYEDPDSAAEKAAYANSKNLGGVAIVDVSMDDFRELCAANKFPILRAAKYRL